MITSLPSVLLARTPTTAIEPPTSAFPDAAVASLPIATALSRGLSSSLLTGLPFPEVAVVLTGFGVAFWPLSGVSFLSQVAPPLGGSGGVEGVLLPPRVLLLFIRR